MMNNESTENQYSPAELIKEKFIELKDNPMSKYFFLYFLHLLGHLDYREENNQCTYSKGDTVFEVALPVIDSHEKYMELERLHKNLEKFFKFLEKSSSGSEHIEIQLLENL